VLRLVMGKGLVLVGTGTAIGLVMGLALERLMNSTLFNAGGVDIVAYVVIVPSLLLATLLATYVPARRASRIAPTQAHVPSDSKVRADRWPLRGRNVISYWHIRKEYPWQLFH
jgi:predicted lysophospholipase L1 biosynthesis ABC-type transport system permease subunit